MRRAIWGRISWKDAGRLAHRPSDRPRSIERRIARARAWAVLELYEPAWNEFIALEQALPAGRLRARVRSDLLILSYYLARPLDEAAFAQAVEAEAEGERGVLADLHLALALRAAARNDVHEAIRQVHFGLDIGTLGAPEEELPVTLPLLRVKAHVLAQAACYRDAMWVSDRAVALSRPTGDQWEIARSIYSRGFVLWCQGHARDAIAEFDSALALTQGVTSSLPRWIRCSRARALAELGRVEEADADLAASSHHLPEDVAYLAIVRGEPEVAERILAPSASARDPFVLALLGISQSFRGRTQEGEAHLSAAEVAFAAGGLNHYALATQIHLGFCRDQHRHGAGRGRARKAAVELAARGAHGFAWPHPSVSSWLYTVIGGDPRTAGFALSEPGDAERVPVALRLHAIGLTRREAEIVLEISQRSRRTDAPTRKALAAELGISANTLRVHMMRIRSKLDVSARGDAAVIAAIDGALEASGGEPAGGHAFPGPPHLPSQASERITRPETQTRVARRVSPGRP